MILRFGVLRLGPNNITLIDGVICNVKVKPRLYDEDAGYADNDGQVISLLAYLRGRQAWLNRSCRALEQ
jgi:hypothetical protein